MTSDRKAGLRIISAGAGTTLQDAGRHGYLRYGITAAGPMDSLAHATANLALGNPPGATAIEVSIGGIELAAESAPLTIAVAGGEFAIHVDNRLLPAGAVVATLEPGAVLKIRAGQSGAWCYVAVAGRFDLPQILGSHATHARTGVGGIDGRTLRADDRLPVETADRSALPLARIVAPWLDRPPGIVRVVLGPQDDFFDEQQIAVFRDVPWTVSARADRMAFYLDGPTLTHARGYNIVSDGIAMGAIQVPGNGRPLVLMADRQSTGGYPKIATVIGPDLGRLAQTRAGMQFRFEIVSVEEAVAARRAEAARLAQGVVLGPLVRSEFSPEFLLAVNLIDGFLAAGD
jgi:5-oxoprolinase (ATP-hydrolysing) subunit C